MSPEPPLQLVSFHSTSKGFLGECGLRGGYLELVGFDADVQAQLLKLVSIGLCSNTLGQIGTGLMVRPPKAGEASYPAFKAERNRRLRLEPWTEQRPQRGAARLTRAQRPTVLSYPTSVLATEAECLRATNWAAIG